MRWLTDSFKRIKKAEKGFNMVIKGGCYCKEVRYRAQGDPLFAGQCHCRECQYLTGGNPNVIMAMPDEGFEFTSGETQKFTRSDIDNAVTREFCGNCGTSIGTRSPQMPGAIILKVGTLDDQSVFEPQMAIYTCDAQQYHHIPEGLPAFDKVPG
ncbi:MAG: hypothetical protein ACJA2O_001471 [Candidatus Azotimanducaceae bacterium]|jgi:hypothetical protein